ncbi:hypothetical protein GCM10027299_21640 [Larkinella ripae]
MPYNPRYEFYFHDDDQSRLYRTRLLDRDYLGGPITEIFHSESPIEWEVKGSDDPFESMLGIFVRMGTVTSADGIQLRDLYTEDDRKWRVIIDHITDGDQIIANVFTGYLTPFEARESYMQMPFPNKLSATCGLGTLKDYPFNNFPSNLPRIENTTALAMVKLCLLWLGYALPIAISVNCVEASMMQSPTMRPPAPYSVLDNYMIDPHRFKTDTGMRSCYDVLKANLDVMNAVIVQDRGEWKIMRLDEYPNHVVNNGAVPFVVYDENYFNPVFFGVQRDILRNINRDSIGQPLAGGELSIDPSERKLTARFEYGDLKNELKNGDFFDQLNNWTQSGNAATWTGDGSQENPYGVKFTGLSDNYIQRNDNVSIRQSLEYPARSGNVDELKLTFSYVNINCVGAKISVMATVQNKGVYFLQPDGTWLSNGQKTVYYIFNDNVRVDNNGFDQSKPTEGQKVEIPMNPVPGRDRYRIDVYLFRGRIFKNQNNVNPTPAPYIIYRDIKITKRDASRVDLTGEEVRGEAPGADRKRQATELTLEVGDQSSSKVTRNVFTTANNPGGELIPVIAYYPRYGALLRMDGTPTEKWLSYGADPTIPGNFKKLQVLCVTGRLQQTGKPARVFDGDLLLRKGQHIGPMDLLYFEEIQMYARIVGGYKWDIKTNVVSVRAVEVMVTAPIDIDNYWQTPGGLERMDGDANQPGGKNPLAGAYTPGQLQEILDRKPGDIKLGKAFTYNSLLGLPTGERPAPGTIIEGLLRSGKFKFFRPTDG